MVRDHTKPEYQMMTSDTPRRQGKDVVSRDVPARAPGIDQAERERAPADRRDLLPLHLA
jgi:hypothetical protein